MKKFFRESCHRSFSRPLNTLQKLSNSKKKLWLRWISPHNVKDIGRNLIHDVNPSQLSGASHRSSEEALLDARRDTVTHRATRRNCLWMYFLHCWIHARPWVWDIADVIFLKKDGKTDYSKAGSYYIDRFLFFNILNPVITVMDCGYYMFIAINIITNKLEYRKKNFRKTKFKFYCHYNE